MTQDSELERLLNARTGIPPTDDTPSDTSAGDAPATTEDLDEED
jgi:hypothetical protein